MLNQAQIAGQQMRRRNDQNRLDELELTQGQFDDERDRLNASPHPGAPYSGYSNEHEYREGLNRQGEIAGLRSKMSGKGGLNVSHTYAGTDFARRPALSDNPYRVEQRGNIARDELRRNAHAAGEASADQASGQYFGTAGIRDDQR